MKGVLFNMSSSMIVTDEAYRLKLNYEPNRACALPPLTAARNDRAAFQLILQSDRQYSVNIGGCDWYTGKKRASVAYERLRVAVSSPFPSEMRLEEFLTDDDGVRKADLLLCQDVRESAAGIPTAVWVELAIPADAAPGEYAVEISLYASPMGADEVLVRRETVSLMVTDVAMPDPRDYAFRLDLWQHTSNIARKHDVPLWSDRHFAVLEQYAASLAAIGQKSITVTASEIPWRGQGCLQDRQFGGNLFESSMIRIRRSKDGIFSYDYSPMQRYIDLCTAQGIGGDIEVFGIINVWADPILDTEKLCPEYPEFIRLHYLDEADGCMKYMTRAEDIRDYVRALEAYFLRTGQIDRVRIAADEPGDREKFRVSLALLEELAPHFRCKTAINHAEFIEAFHDRIDDFVPYLRCAVVEYGRLKECQKQYPDKKFLWYVCCGGASPNTFLRTPPIESRMIGILTSVLGFDGFLRWNYTVWPDDPRNDIRYSAFEAGDTNFVYPAHDGGVLLSLRYKNLKRGIEDFELLRRLAEKRGEDAVRKVLRHVLRTERVEDFWHDGGLLPSEQLFSLTYADYEAAKAETLRLLAEK